MRFAVCLLLALPVAATAQDRALYGRGEVLEGRSPGLRSSNTPNGGVRLGGPGAQRLGAETGVIAPRQVGAPYDGAASTLVHQIAPTPFRDLADQFTGSVRAGDDTEASVDRPR